MELRAGGDPVTRGWSAKRVLERRDVRRENPRGLPKATAEDPADADGTCMGGNYPQSHGTTSYKEVQE